MLLDVALGVVLTPYALRVSNFVDTVSNLRHSMMRPRLTAPDALG